MNQIPPVKLDQPCKYNPEQIEDFLDHLRWEIVILDFENQPKAPVITQKQMDEASLDNMPKGMNPELVEQLMQFISKYNCAALLPTNRIDTRNQTPERIQKAIQSYRDTKRKKIKQYLDALEILKPLFTKAIDAIKAAFGVRS